MNIFKKNLWLALLLQVKVFVVISAGGSFCREYVTDTFYRVMLVTRSVAVIQVLRFRGTSFYSYDGESFCCNYAGDCFSEYVCAIQFLFRLRFSA